MILLSSSILRLKRSLAPGKVPETRRVSRKIMGISNDWGTARYYTRNGFWKCFPTIWNRHLFFNPRWSEDSLRLWGDFTIGNQGEDVASGLVNTLPISIIQQDIEMPETDITLESHFAEIYKALKDLANELIHIRGWGPQEMEFTFESPRAEDFFPDANPGHGHS